MIIERQRVRTLLRDGAQLVEVLPRKEFAQEHIEGAINIPLAEIPERAPRELDRNAPVVVYCWDYECDLSPRAAMRLRMLDFEAYDYAASKKDWIAAGLPTEGDEIPSDRLGALCASDVPIAHADDRVDDVLSVIDDHWPLAVVVGDRGVVLGTLDRRRAEEHRGDRVLEAMREAPRTYRADTQLSKIRNGDRHLIVTDAGGTLLGLVDREGVIPLDSLEHHQARSA